MEQDTEAAVTETVTKDHIRAASESDESGMVGGRGWEGILMEIGSIVSLLL